MYKFNRKLKSYSGADAGPSTENKEEGRELEDAMEKSTLCVTGVLEGEKRIKQK